MSEENFQGKRKSRCKGGRRTMVQSKMKYEQTE